ncbi:MAG: OsmC family protein [Bryobacteraceae bacterium]
MEVVINHLGDVQFEVKARNHTVYCDQPTDAGGYDEGMTPPELFLASLGTCAGYYVAQYAKANNLHAIGLRVRVTAEKAKAPARLDDLRIFIEYPENVDAVHREGLEKAVHKCLIHNTLLHPPKITTEIHAGEQMARAA